MLQEMPVGAIMHLSATSKCGVLLNKLGKIDADSNLNKAVDSLMSEIRVHPGMCATILVIYLVTAIAADIAVYVINNRILHHFFYVYVNEFASHPYGDYIVFCFGKLLMFDFVLK